MCGAIYIVYRYLHACDCGCVVDGSARGAMQPAPVLYNIRQHKLIIILIKLELLSGHAYMYNMYIKYCTKINIVIQKLAYNIINNITKKVIQKLSIIM